MNPASILNQLKAESLLEDSHILKQVDTLRNGLRYKTDGEEVSFDDFFQTLQSEIAELPRIELESTITPGTESLYQIQLVTALESVFDDADRVLNRLLFFQSKLQAAQQQFQVLEVTFIAWYSIAATEFLNAPDFKAIKLNATAIKALAQSEFGRLMEGVHIDVETLLEVTKVLSKQILSHKTVAQEKYNLGKDQVNASWTSNNLPPEGIAGGEEGQELISPTDPEPEEENIPAFVSKTPVIAPRLGPGDETIRQITEQNEQAVDELVKEIETSGTVNGKPIDQLTLPPQKTSYPRRPTIKELDEILNSEEQTPVEILPNGEIRAIPAPELVLETPATTIEVTAVNAEGETISFVTEGAIIDKLILEADQKGLTLVMEDTVPGLSSAADVDTIVPENSLLPPGVKLNATPIVKTSTGTVVIRTKEGFPDKIKCKNCNRRIRVNQTMIAVDDRWAHVEEDDCGEEISNTHPGMPPPEFSGNLVPAIIGNTLVHAPAKIKGTFVKYGEPIEVVAIPGEYSRDEVRKIEQEEPVSNTFRPILTTRVTVPIDREKIRKQILNNPDLSVEAGEEISSSTILGVLEQQAAVPKPERKKITILPEDAEV
jgi:hypothetical protein